MRPTRRRLIVSVHDVAPSTLDGVRWLLDALDSMELVPRVLCVIPAEGGHADLRRSPKVADLLRRERAKGTEVVLHGYSHRAAGPLRGPLLERLRGRVFAAPVAEFLTLDAGQLATRLLAGRQILRDLGVEAHGVCAPGWLGVPELRAVLRGIGFRHYIGLASVWDLAARRRRWTPWLGYMGVGSAHERLVQVAGRLMLAAAPLFDAVSVFLHPQQAAVAPSCRHVLDTLAQLRRERHPVTYEQYLAGWP